MACSPAPQQLAHNNGARGTAGRRAAVAVHQQHDVRRVASRRLSQMQSRLRISPLSSRQKLVTSISVSCHQSAHCRVLWRFVPALPICGQRPQRSPASWPRPLSADFCAQRCEGRRQLADACSASIQHACCAAARAAGPAPALGPAGGREFAGFGRLVGGIYGGLQRAAPSPPAGGRALICAGPVAARLFFVRAASVRAFCYGIGGRHRRRFGRRHR